MSTINTEFNDLLIAESESGNDQRRLEMESTVCCLCESDRSIEIATGLDFEYHSSPDSFTAFECKSCGLVFLNPRPKESEFETIYPDSYHAFEFSADEYGFVYKIRRQLEAKRLLSWCAGINENASILDIGCGDGFHLDLLTEFGDKSWILKGVDLDKRAVAICVKKKLDVKCGTLAEVGFENGSFDLAFTIQTVEHVANPVGFLKEIRRVLKPGGKLIVVTDNTGTPDFRLFKKRHWGGYHFPRHWNLFNKQNAELLAQKTGFAIDSISTQVSPVNWTYSIRNWLVDKNAPAWLFERFSLKSTVSLSFFTLLDTFLNSLGNGALLNLRFNKSDKD